MTGPLGDPVDAEWGVLPGGVAVVEMAQRERARARAAVATIRCARARAAPASSSRPRAREGFRRDRRRGRRQRDDRRRARRGRGAGVVVAGRSTVTVACDVETPFLDAATRVTARRRARADAQVALLTPAPDSCSPTSTGSAPASTSRTLDRRAARPAGSPAGSPRSARELEPGFDVVAEAVGLEAALEGVDLVVTGEGRLDASSLAGKVVGGVLEWAADARRAERRGRSPARSTDDAREALADRAGVQRARAHRPRVAVGETYSRAALLVEEAALEAGRRPLYRLARQPRIAGRTRNAAAVRSARVTIGGRSRTSTALALSTVPSGCARRSARARRRRLSTGSSRRVASAVDEDRERLRAELVERAVAVLAHAEVDLRDRVAAEACRRGRRAARARRPSPRRTAAPRAASRRPAYSPPSGCTMSASFGNSSESNGPGDELGDAAAAGRRACERAAVVRPSRTRCRGRRAAARAAGSTKSRAEVAQVGVEPADDVAVAGVAATSTARCPCPSPGRPRGGSSPRRRPGRPAQRATSAVASVEPSSMTTTSSTRPACSTRLRRTVGDDVRRRSPPRCAPAGRPRSWCRSPLGLDQLGDVGPGLPSRQGTRAGRLIGGAGGRRAILRRQRAHPERLRDRPCDAAATSTTDRTTGPRSEPGANA